MTSTIDIPAIRTAPTPPDLAAAPNCDESAVAVTLAWHFDDRAATQGATGPAEGSQPGGGSHIVELIGDIDTYLVVRVRRTLASVARQSRDLAVDVSGVRFIDASGLGLLVMMRRIVASAGGEMTLIGATPQLRRVLHVTRLEHLLRWPGAPLTGEVWRVPRSGV